jgi:hypothetical protein
MYDRTARKADGYARMDFDGKVTESDTKMCVHCGAHFLVIPGSRRIRGFCLPCMGVTCGSPGCIECRPMEKWLDQQDGG